MIVVVLFILFFLCFETVARLYMLICMNADTLNEATDVLRR